MQAPVPQRMSRKPALQNQCDPLLRGELLSVLLRVVEHFGAVYQPQG